MRGDVRQTAEGEAGSPNFGLSYSLQRSSFITTQFIALAAVVLLVSCGPKGEIAPTPAGVSEAQLLELLDELRPVDIVDTDKQRFGPTEDGGYVMIAGQDYDALYSYGIGSNMGFEVHFVQEASVPAYLYDHTIQSLPEESHSSLIRWKQEGIGPRRTAHLNSLTAHIEENGDAGKEDLLLKMDVEGAEWLSLSETRDDVLLRFKQIVIELHELGEEGPYQDQLRTLRKLNRSFHLAHVHGNNRSNRRIAGDSIVPNVLEVTYVRRRDFVADASTAHYPIPGLDFPNDLNRRDILLDFYPFVPAPVE